MTSQVFIAGTTSGFEATPYNCHNVTKIIRVSINCVTGLTVDLASVAVKVKICTTSLADTFSEVTGQKRVIFQFLLNRKK